MKIFKSLSPEAAKLIKRGGVGVVPTDTIYGIVGSALSETAVSRIYKLRKRMPSKPFIVLIGSLGDLKKFGVKLSKGDIKIVKKFWPGGVSIALRCPFEKFFYLHRGTGTVAFRLPAEKTLRKFLKSAGPVAAPSANPEGEPPAETIGEARGYFGNRVDFYVNGGKISGQPSTLIRLENDGVSVLRQGTVEIEE